MYLSPVIERHLISTLQEARTNAESAINFFRSRSRTPRDELSNEIEKQFKQINAQHFRQPSGERNNIYVLNEVSIKNEIEYTHEYSASRDHDYTKSFIGSGLWAVGQPILKKRFVMKGSAAGTSIASKYLSQILPQRMPVKILGTAVLGRAIGRITPYVGVALIAIDVVDLIIEEIEASKNGSFRGLGGGYSGGAGASGSW